MRQFTDTLGRVWTLSLNVFTLKKVKDETGRLLTALGDDNCKLLVELHEDCELLVNVLWCLCEKQAAAHGVVDDKEYLATEKFAMGLGGDSLANAVDALVGAITDFFSSREQREALTKLMEKVKQMQEAMGRTLLTQIEEIDPETLAASATGSASSLPPSQESTPGNIRLAN